jgi:hypothetical protein
MRTWSECLGGAAVARWIVLIAVVACDEAQPKSRTPAPSASATATTSVMSPANAVGNSVKMDVPPSPVPPKQRLRQKQLGSRLVIDREGRWAPDCMIHRPCRTVAKALDIRAEERGAEAWATLSGKAERFTNPQVSIKGNLAMSNNAFSTAVGCAKNQRCNRRSAKLGLAGPPYDLELVGLGCGGDESRLCCALSARGEEVIASGRLSYQTGRLLLHSPELCRTKND